MPVGAFCLARKHGTVEELPVKAPKKPAPLEQRTVLVIQDGAGTAIRKRPDTGLLAGLYELPNVEGHLTEKAALARVKAMGLEHCGSKHCRMRSTFFPILNGGCVLIVSLYPLWKKHRRGSSCLWIRENPIKNMQYHLRFAHTPDI